jgi:Tol biopolymer transport system component
MLLLLLASPAAVAIQATVPQLASKTYLGMPPFGPSDNPRLSSDGRFLVYFCLSGDILPGDDNDRYDTFLLDRDSGATRRVSFNAANQQQQSHSGTGYPSDDGLQVVFDGQGMFHPDVVYVPPGTPDYETQNVFLRDLTVPSTQLLSRALSGEGNPQREGALIQDVLMSRTSVLFASTADYVGDRGPNPEPSFIQEIYSRDWSSGAVERISARPDGSRSNRGAGNASYSPDGRFVIFESRASDITSDNPGQMPQLFVRDRLTGSTARVSKPWSAAEFSGAPNYRTPRLSAGGRFVVFTASLNDEFTPDDNPGVGDTYLIDRQAGTTELVSRTHDGASSDGSSLGADMSADGRVIAFYSRATNLLPGQPAVPAVYVKDRYTGAMINATATLGEVTQFFISQIDLSADGRHLAFSWRVNDPGQPLLHDRVVIYTVELSGFGAPPETVPVPAGSLFGWAIIASLLALLGLGNLATAGRREGRLGVN